MVIEPGVVANAIAGQEVTLPPRSCPQCDRQALRVKLISTPSILFRTLAVWCPDCSVKVTQDISSLDLFKAEGARVALFQHFVGLAIAAFPNIRATLAARKDSAHGSR